MEFNTEELREIFDIIDTKKEGKVNVDFIKEALVYLQWDKKNPVVFNFINELKGGECSFEEIKEEIDGLLTDANDNMGYQRMFDFFKNQMDSTNMTGDELKKKCLELGVRFTDEDIDYLMGQIGDGKTITFEQLVEFMEKKI